MKTFKNRENHSIEIAFVLTIFLHFLFYVLFCLIFFNNNENTSDQVVFLDFKTIKKLEIKNFNLIQNEIIQQSVKGRNKKKLSVKSINSLENFYTIIDSNISEKFDSLIYSKSISDSSKTFDDFIFGNPNLIALKIALKENIDKGVVKKTDAKITEERIRKAMFDYYKAKYPTPPYRFGERGTGNIINIPIEDVIELFK